MGEYYTLGAGENGCWQVTQGRGTPVQTFNSVNFVNISGLAENGATSIAIDSATLTDNGDGTATLSQP